MSYAEIRNPKSRKFTGAITRLGEVYTAPGEPILTLQTDSRDTYLVQQMHALAQSIYQAKQRNDVATVQALLVRFKPLADEYRDRGSIGVSPFDQFYLATGEWVKQVLAGVPGVLASGSLGLLKGLWPLLLVAGGFLYVKSKF